MSLHLLAELCDSFGIHLNHLLNSQDFGEVYQLAKRILKERCLREESDPRLDILN
jgi:hypothetical protein